MRRSWRPAWRSARGRGSSAGAVIGEGARIEAGVAIADGARLAPGEVAS